MAIIIRVYPTHEKEKRVEKKQEGGRGGRVKRSQEDALYIERHQVSFKKRWSLQTTAYPTDVFRFLHAQQARERGVKRIPVRSPAICIGWDTCGLRGL